MKKQYAGILLFVLFGTSAHAALQSRALGQAYYDTVLNITWLADANLAATNTFGVTGINANGTLTWVEANDWIAAMNAANYLGISNWRLPNIIDTGSVGCNWAYSGTDCGFNVDLSTSEMAHLHYGTLGNIGSFDTSGISTGCGGALPNRCVANAGPFSNIQTDRTYWSGTTNPLNPSNAWHFYFGNGGTDVFFSKSENNNLVAWAVSSGDSLNAPVPGAVWLFGSALAAIGALRRHQKA